MEGKSKSQFGPPGNARVPSNETSPVVGEVSVGSVTRDDVLMTALLIVATRYGFEALKGVVVRKRAVGEAVALADQLAADLRELGI